MGGCERNHVNLSLPDCKGPTSVTADLLVGGPHPETISCVVLYSYFTDSALMISSVSCLSLNGHSLSLSKVCNNSIKMLLHLQSGKHNTDTHTRSNIVRTTVVCCSHSYTSYDYTDRHLRHIKGIPDLIKSTSSTVRSLLARHGNGLGLSRDAFRAKPTKSKRKEGSSSLPTPPKTGGM